MPPNEGLPPFRPMQDMLPSEMAHVMPQGLALGPDGEQNEMQLPVGILVNPAEASEDDQPPRVEVVVLNQGGRVVPPYQLRHLQGEPQLPTNEGEEPLFPSGSHHSRRLGSSRSASDNLSADITLSATGTMSESSSDTHSATSSASESNSIGSEEPAEEDVLPDAPEEEVQRRRTPTRGRQLTPTPSEDGADEQGAPKQSESVERSDDHGLSMRRSMRINAAYRRTHIGEMVKAAINVRGRRTRKGVSFHAIKKYIAEQYSPIENVRSLKRYVVAAVKRGEIVQMTGKGAAGSFRLPETAATKPIKKPKIARKVAQKVARKVLVGPKKRGRPSLKNKSVVRRPKVSRVVKPKKTRSLVIRRMTRGRRVMAGRQFTRTRSLTVAGRRAQAIALQKTRRRPTILNRTVSRMLVRAASNIVAQAARGVLTRAVSRAQLSGRAPAVRTETEQH